MPPVCIGEAHSKFQKLLSQILGTFGLEGALWTEVDERRLRAASHPGPGRVGCGEEADLPCALNELCGPWQVG